MPLYVAKCTYLNKHMHAYSISSVQPCKSKGRFRLLYATTIDLGEENIPVCNFDGYIHEASHTGYGTYNPKKKK